MLDNDENSGQNKPQLKEQDDRIHNMIHPSLLQVDQHIQQNIVHFDLFDSQTQSIEPFEGITQIIEQQAQILAQPQKKKIAKSQKIRAQQTQCHLSYISQRHVLTNLDLLQKNRIVLFIQQLNMKEDLGFVFRHQFELSDQDSQIEESQGLISDEMFSSTLSIQTVMALEDKMDEYTLQEQEELKNCFDLTNCQIIANLIIIMQSTNKLRYLHNV